SAGRHELTQATPSTPAWKPLTAQLPALVEQGQKLRAAALEQANRPVAPEGAPWQAAMQADVGANVGTNVRTKVSSIVQMNTAQGPLMALATDKVIHVLTPAGQPVRRMETDGNIRNLHWWDKPKLLLAGCVDEKLIAFDEQGQRKWTFVSEMHPAVLEAAKQYWFKGAHPGIYGIGSGEFLDGKEQCFLGSACTLEILDDQGQLVKRMAAFWGAGSHFWLNPREDGSIDLLFAKEPTESHAVYVLNNKKMNLHYSFHGVPGGHTYVGGWANMSRDHLFIADLDGDEKKEAISEINGIWNRITVWNEDGGALYNAQFGPGNPIPTRNMRDLEVMDLNGDGKQEVIAATSAGLLVVLDSHLQKVWSVRLPVAATVLKAVTVKGAPAIIVGLQNGDVLQLDAQGKTILRGHVDGTPNEIMGLTADGKPQVVITTSKGMVAGFAY
ncbi:MAG: hypothetical protein KKI08_27430, partial [Armatimonadetes bacterium]|nr:hypothetical protein [Armatimonadota bacterium]